MWKWLLMAMFGPRYKESDADSSSPGLVTPYASEVKPDCAKLRRKTVDSVCTESSADNRLPSRVRPYTAVELSKQAGLWRSIGGPGCKRSGADSVTPK